MPAQTKTDCRINATVGFLINTAKLTMLPLSMTDKVLYQQLYCNAEVCKYIGGAISREQATIGFQRSIKQNNIGKRLTWVIKDKCSNERLGICACVWPKKSSVNNQDNPSVNPKQEAELGILLLPQYCGKGIAEEALSSLTQYCLTQLNIAKLELNCGKDNIAAQRLNQKLSPAYKSNHDLSYWTITKEGLRDRN